MEDEQKGTPKRVVCPDFGPRRSAIRLALMTHNAEVNLSQALTIVNRPLNVWGTSDSALAKTVNATTGPAGPHLAEAPGLDGTFPIRAVDVLLRLATATRPRYQADVLEVHLHWGLLRYLGFFDHSYDGSTMLLSPAGNRITGNQRRVTSEEVGIGFAVLLAESWMSPTGGPPIVTRPIDVDVALHDMNGTIFARGRPKNVKKIGTKRPDYILVSDTPGRPQAVRLAVLECKGTKTYNHAFKQLSTAAHQLHGIVVDGRHPPGLAVSTLLSNSPIGFYALESPREPRRGHADPQQPRDYMAAAPRFEQSESEFVPAFEVDVDISEANLAPDNTDIDVSTSESVGAERLAVAALQASWASIADMAGNDVAFRRWASGPMLRRLNRDQGAQRERVARPLANGMTIRGVRNVVTLPGGRLEVVLGVESGVDDALSSTEPRRIIAAQQRLRHVRNERPDDGQAGDQVASVNSDGSALVLTPM